jgi:hypothetical protein
MDYAATQSTAVQASCTLADLERMVERIRALTPAIEPLAAWMIEQGRDPAEGWVLFVSPQMLAEGGPFPPRYLRASPFVTRPVFANSRTLQALRVEG